MTPRPDPVEELAYAKLNLVLPVGPPQPDGLHPICSIFASLDLADDVHVRAGDGPVDTIQCEGVEDPTLAAAAVSALREEVPSLPPLDVRIDKRIPVAAGLGGGSADAAAALRAANRLAGDPLDADALRTIAATIGSDVPSQVEPGHALVAGTGELVEPIALPPLAAVLVPQAEGLSTGDVYARLDRMEGWREFLDVEAVRAAVDSDPSSWETAFENDLQQAALATRPELVAVIAGLRAAGAVVARVSGSGPTCFGLFADAGAAEATAEAMPGAFIGLVAPGETVVIAGGVIAGQGEIDLVPLIGLVWICAVLGDTTSFYLGRRLGRRFLERHGPRVKITPERLMSVEGYFDRHGGKTILIGRFIGLVRALAPFIAGTSGMPFRRFIPFSIVGTGLWSTAFCVLGYIFWRSFDQVAHLAGQAIFGFGVTVAVIVGIVVAYRRRAEIRAWILAHERHPLVRPLLAVWRPLHRRVFGPVARAIVPQLRFLWGRLTPGGLGLELTTAIAAGAVGLYVFGLYVVVLSGDLNATPLDRELLDLGDRMRSEAAVDVVEIISGFGSFAACATVIAVTSVLLALRRRAAEIVVLVLGFALIYVGVHLAQAGVDRPRPAAPLTGSTQSAFPSGHAAYATAWIAAALVVTRRLGLVGHATLVTGAIALAAAVGLSRIYLRVHYWSDVAGGWGLGVGTFATLAAIAMLVQHMRHNDREPAPRPIARARR